MTTDILTTQMGEVGLIALNRPQALNALSMEMIEDINQALSHWLVQPDIRAVCIHSNIDRAFCAGGDIRWLYQQAHHNKSTQTNFFEREYQLNYRMSRFPKPIISLINGLTMGGGIGISLHNAIRIASDKAVFAMPETAIGFFPDIGACYLLSRCTGATGLYLALTGARLTAFDAQSLGLIDHVIDHQVLNQARLALAQCDFIERGSAMIGDHFGQYVVENPDVQIMGGYYDAINTIFNADSVEIIFERLSNQNDNWSLSILQLLKERSPLSLKVTFEQMKRAKGSSLEQCLQMDYGLAQHFMQAHDFYEGVRAMVIEKDKHPQWHFASLESVSEETVRQFFVQSGDVLNLSKQAVE